MCELIAPDSRYLRDALLSELAVGDAIRSSTTAVVLRQFKIDDQWSEPLLQRGEHEGRTPPVVVDPPVERPARLDELDSRLLAELGADGRRSYSDLATDLGLSETTVARRIAALVAARRLYFLALVDPAAIGYHLEALIHFRVEPTALEVAAATLGAASQVRYIAATTGASDLTCDAVFQDTDDLYEFLTRTIAGVRGIVQADVDVVLESVKRQYHYPLFGSTTVPPKKTRGRSRPTS